MHYLRQSRWFMFAALAMNAAWAGAVPPGDWVHYGYPGSAPPCDRPRKLRRTLRHCWRTRLHRITPLDAYLRAFDAQSGEVLWQTKLPTGGHAIPISYLGSDGRQYIAICAGGHTKLGTQAGDAFLAFALP